MLAYLGRVSAVHSQRSLKKPYKPSMEHPSNWTAPRVYNTCQLNGSKNLQRSTTSHWWSPLPTEQLLLFIAAIIKMSLNLTHKNIHCGYRYNHCKWVYSILLILMDQHWNWHAGVIISIYSLKGIWRESCCLLKQFSANRWRPVITCTAVIEA